ncbi:unnamed protein product [Acanthoscelides obtectus]|uniref:THO complex subunit 7 n=1 Tax=Acanthoscelides obtectus TaxID=200917 RepID=A0A9P0JPZ3_ACAOB|nr:unnamed protein product [Acanthoscelides obtectus]CAH1998544.1 unnamed protein product [Acanthoscelides obtectus]CAK1621143.1 THO complex subunit 7 homolog [Acanthoscelides obtectus]CAK1686787.1 THO complex subunit 7 homolog [Acanthoscelides obtectus]
MSDEEVIKRRLIFDGYGTGDDRRFNLMLKQLTKWTNHPDDSSEEYKHMYDKILAQLSLTEHSRKKAELVVRANNDQLNKYQQLHGDFEQQINDIKNEIANQKVELENAKKVKQNRIQYDMLARSIEAEPPRKQMNAQLTRLQEELKALGEEKKKLVGKLDKRKKQFYVLSTSANQLRMYLEEDNNDCSVIEGPMEVIDVSNSPEPMSE